MKLDLVRADLKVALRSLRRDPRYAFVVIFTLAIGISANTVIFSVMNPYLLRELPFRDAASLVQLGHVDTTNDWDMARFSMAQLADLRQQSKGLETLGAYRYGKRNLVDDRGPEQVMSGYLSSNMLELLGVQPLLGRGFSIEDEGEGAAGVAVLSHTLWNRRYNGRNDVIGTVITLSSESFEVIGVMPREFDFPFGEVRLWTALPDSFDQAARDQQWSHIVARLRPGWSQDQILAELNGIHARLAQLHPDEDGRFAGVSVVPLRQALNFAYEILRYSFLTLLTAVTLLLLLACVNVASLTLARSTARTKEVAIRAAVGASRIRIVTQLFVEGLVLAGIACTVGIGLSAAVLRVIAPVLPAEALFKSGDFTIDLKVVGYAVCVSLLTPLVFSLMPALKATSHDLIGGLRESDPGSGGAVRNRRLLVVLETAIAIVLVSAAALAAQGLRSAVMTDVGIQHERLLSAEIALPGTEYPSPNEVVQFYDDATARLRGLPGVREVGRVARLPFNHETSSIGFSLPNAIPSDPEKLFVAETNGVSTTYFDAVGMRLESGRFFNSTDLENRTGTVVISQSIAHRYWRERSPIGETLMVGDYGKLQPTTVVGVVSNVKTEGLKDPREGHIYRPIGARQRQFLVLATDTAPAASISPVRDELRRVAPSLPAMIRPMTDVVRENMLQWVITSLFFTLFGGIALLLTTLGIYGVMAYSVARRTREFGIRLAVGASSHRLSRMVVMEGLRLAGVGVGIGLAVSVGMAVFVARMVPGINPADITTYVVTVSLFALVSAAASFGPALRASRCDPQTALRYQ
ncbi:MAG: ABC transporter permease [bacterium]|nr:ABC transporter permease [bacterium]